MRKLLAEQDLPDPKTFLLTVMHDRRRAMKTRIDAAKAVIGYCHPKLSTVSNTVEFGGTGWNWSVYSDEQLDTLVELLELGHPELRHPETRA